MTPREDMTTLQDQPTVAEQADVWFERRLAELSSYDKRTAAQCAAALVESAPLEIADVEVLESLFFLALGHPKIAERQEISAAETGRRLAPALEQAGEADRAIAVLRRLAQDNPESRAIERELAGVMRRAGRVQELVDRYMERAHALLKRGRTMEAIPWLREVLLVDRSRRDVARLIRDLRYEDVEKATRSRRRLRSAFIFLLLVGLGALLALREIELHRGYEALTAGAVKGLEGTRRRLADLERFASEHPVWHGSFGVRHQMASLRAEVARLELESLELEDQQEEIGEQRLLRARRERELGLERAEAGDLTQALAHLEEALRWGDGGWPDRVQTERDVQAIRKWLEEGE